MLPLAGQSARLGNYRPRLQELASMTRRPITNALRDALRKITDRRCAEDLIFLEAWERAPMAGSAAALRIVQLRRANPTLAAAIRAELGQKPALA
jgi:hypothetical protein